MNKEDINYRQGRSKKQIESSYVPSNVIQIACHFWVLSPSYFRNGCSQEIGWSYSATNIRINKYLRSIDDELSSRAVMVFLACYKESENSDFTFYTMPDVIDICTKLME